MRFGNADAFAIEAVLIEIYQKWIYGKLQFWIGGLSIGDFDDTSDLASSARWGRTFLTATSRRTRVDLDVASPVEVYEKLYGDFVVDITRVKGWQDKTFSGRVWDRDPYLLDDVGESALRDKFAVVVMRRGDGSDRIVVKSFNDEAVSEVLLPPGVCDATVESYCDWVERLSRNSS